MSNELTTTGSFYEGITPFADFVDLNAASHYRAAPRDWWVVITDVKGSTKAIEEGRYKDVNLLGAATVACVTNVLGDQPFPFVFGGDGATALIPSESKDKVAEELNALRKMSLKGFDLGMRVGFVPVAELEDEGYPVLVAKYSLNPHLSIAMFQGGALTRAEEKIKDEEGGYELPDLGETSTDLSALSCNWKPIQARHGHVLSLLVLARGTEPAEVYREFLKDLDAIFVGGVQEANPVHVENLRLRGMGTLLKNDGKVARGFAKIRRYGFTLFVSILFGLGLRHLIRPMTRYLRSKRSHSDYRKFDDALRMTIDCTTAQLSAVNELCKGLESDGRLHYGIHVSKSALMTCFLQSVDNGKHIHFIDGGDGGYAMAAKQLKSQIKHATQGEA